MRGEFSGALGDFIQQVIDNTLVFDEHRTNESIVDDQRSVPADWQEAPSQEEALRQLKHFLSFRRKLEQHQ